MSKHVSSRRSLLRRLGTVGFLAAPVFRGVLVEEARAAAAQRFIAVVFAGGARYNTPQGTAASNTVGHTNHNFTWDKYLASLAPYRNDVRVLKGIGDFTRTGGGGHTTLPLLTGISNFGDEEAIKIPAGATSLDQMIAARIGAQSRVRSLQLGLHTEVELALAHGRVSLANGAALAPVTDPRLAFSRLFSGFTAPSTPGPSGPSQADLDAAAKLDRLHAVRKSILDLRAREIEAIKRIAGKAETAKLDEHLTGIRELERALPVPSGGGAVGGGAVASGASCRVPSLANGNDTKTLAASMNEILFQAINCDLTRVVTYQMLGSSVSDSDQSGADFGFLGVSKAHHTLQHEPSDDLDKVQTWLLSQIAALIKRFKEADDGGVSMLDNLGMLVVSEQADGRDHTTTPTLGLLAGKAGGAIRPGTDLVGNNSSMNDLCLALGRAYGLTMGAFGEAKFHRSPIALS